MSMWEILGIAPSSEHKAIKRAYAVKLKMTNPQENPEGFQKLRSAYEQALRYAEYAQYENEEDVKDEGNTQLEDSVNKQEASTEQHDKDKLLNNDYSHEESTLYETEQNDLMLSNLHQEAGVFAKDLSSKLRGTLSKVKARQAIEDLMLGDWFVRLDARYLFQLYFVQEVAKDIDVYYEGVLEEIILKFGWQDHRHEVWRYQAYSMHQIWNRYQAYQDNKAQETKPDKSNSNISPMAIVFLIYIVIRIISGFAEKQKEPETPPELQYHHPDRGHEIESDSAEYMKHINKYDNSFIPDVSKIHDEQLNKSGDVFMPEVSNTDNHQKLIVSP